MLTDEEIARELGRTPIAIRLRGKRDLRLPAPSKNPSLLTGEQIAQGLAIDTHSSMRLIDRGILPGYRLPSQRAIRVVKRIDLLMFATNPMNWIYFDPDRVGTQAFC